jgi:NAD(P)H-hydrate epimerase
MKYITKKDIKLPKRESRSHKGDNGKVLIIGGSENYSGALTLAGLSALRSGCDWVTIATPEKVAWAINCLNSNLITHKLKTSYLSLKHYKELLRLARSYNVVLIGNGTTLRAKPLLKKLIKNIKTLKVIDADGIKSITINDLSNSIITPHNKELEILLRNSRINNNIIKKIINEKSIEKKALLLKSLIYKKTFLNMNNILLLKGMIDIIISKNKIAFNKTGNPGMTKAGTGDVLAGICAGFLAQSKDLWQSAINAAYFNGLVGDILLKKKKGFSYLASDMVEEIKKVIRSYN